MTRYKKFVFGFVAGFNLGLVSYLGYTSYYEKVFSVLTASFFILLPALIGGFLMSLDRSSNINTEGVSPSILNPDFGHGQDFKLTETRIPPKYLAIYSFLFVLTSALNLFLNNYFAAAIFSFIASAFAAFALVKGNKQFSKPFNTALVALALVCFTIFAYSTYYTIMSKL